MCLRPCVRLVACAFARTYACSGVRARAAVSARVQRCACVRACERASVCACVRAWCVCVHACEPSPGADVGGEQSSLEADVAGVSPVPEMLWHGQAHSSALQRADVGHRGDRVGQPTVVQPARLVVLRIAAEVPAASCDRMFVCLRSIHAAPRASQSVVYGVAPQRGGGMPVPRGTVYGAAPPLTRRSS